MTWPLRPEIPNPNAGLTLCAWCRQWRPPSELIAVERVATGTRRYVCRFRFCFRKAIGTPAIDRIIATGAGSGRGEGGRRKVDEFPANWLIPADSRSGSELSGKSLRRRP